MYLTYEEYQAMGGTLDETTFNDYSFEANAIINWYTFSRLKNDTEFPTELKWCVFRIIKIAQLKAQALTLGDNVGENSSMPSPNIKSQANDGVSVSYNSLNASDLFGDDIRDEIENLIKMYLVDVRNQAGKKVLYRGVYKDE